MFNIIHKRNNNIQSDEEQQLHAELVKQLYVLTPVALIATLLNSTIVTFIHWKVISHSVLITWFSVLIFITLLRYALVWRYRRTPVSPAQAHRWKVWFIIGVALSGVTWGTAGIFLFSENSVVHQVFLIFVLGGMVIGAASAYSALKKAFLFYSIPSFVPIVVHFFAIGDEIHVGMGVMALIFVLLTGIIFQYVHSINTTSLKLRFENNSLISNLSKAKERVEKLNEKLRFEIIERQEAEKELKRHQEDLELMVERRTVELTLANKNLQLEIAERKQTEEALQKSESRLRTLVENIPEKIIMKDKNFVYMLSNNNYARDMGIQFEEIMGKTDYDFHPPDLAEKSMAEDREVMTSGKTMEVEEKHTRHGKELVIQVVKTPVYNSQSNVVGVLGIFRDITKRKQIEEELRLSAAVFENTNEGVIITDKDANIVAINKSFTEITGYTSEEVIGKNPKLLKSGRHSQTFYQTMWTSIQEKGQWKGEIWNRRKNGEVYPQWLNISVVKNDQNEVINHVAVFSDISTLKESEKQLEHIATHDTLTNLPNRLLFNDRLEHALEHARRQGTKVALLYMDLDNFKGINDSFGHPFGDRLLQVVADRLTICIRSEDTVARLGGDEFTIIAENITHSYDAAVVAHRVLDSLSKPFAIEGHEIFTTASIGISLYPDHGNDVHVLIKNADTAMYHAKKIGRNKYEFYDSEMTILAQERIMLETALRYAMKRKEFILHYQPQIDVDRRQIVGTEALVRWHKPKIGLIFPNKFIPLSEDIGLISSIGEWVLYTACAQGHAWQLAGYPSLRMAVNISSRQFLKKDFVEKVKQILKETGFTPSLLEIEITESTMMKNIDENIAILKYLKALGIGIAIDDFGVGYSSLSYLKQFSIDRLKIDRSFIKNIPHNSNDMAIASAIIAIARSLGIKVIAEGVETQNQMNFLISQYCTEVQGYIFSPPVPAEEFKRLLDRPYTLLVSHKL
jgi:diguanylate cyclase (GGDEF)-like protein/PAS domain S-box-containing protein